MSLDYSDLIQKKGAAYSQAQVQPQSNYNKSIDKTSGRAYGNSRIWGDASVETQKASIDALMNASKKAGLNVRETAHVLAIARIESGFNPDAAAGTTSASGLGQFISRTGNTYGLNDKNVFDLTAQADALVAHFIDNRNLAMKRGQSEDYIYKYHHDGPSRDYGGLKLSHNDVMPYVKKYEEFVREYSKEHGVEFKLKILDTGVSTQDHTSILERETAPIIKSGMRGNDVKELQVFLTSNGYNTHGADGIFGKNTQVALENFQRDHNLQVDGIFGKNTQAELSKIALGKNQPESIMSLSSEKIQQVLEAMQKVDHLSKDLTLDERKILNQRVETLALEGGINFVPSPKEQIPSTSEVLFNIVGAVGKGLSNSLNRDWALVGGMIGAVAEWGNSLRHDIKLGMDSDRGPVMAVGGHVHPMDFHKVQGMKHYVNSDNKLLGKLDDVSDKFEIFHRNGSKLDPVGTIENFSQQNQITLQDQTQQKVGIIGRTVEGLV